MLLYIVEYQLSLKYIVYSFAKILIKAKKTAQLLPFHIKRFSLLHATGKTGPHNEYSNNNKERSLL